MRFSFEMLFGMVDHLELQELLSLFGSSEIAVKNEEEIMLVHSVLKWNKYTLREEIFAGF